MCRTLSFLNRDTKSRVQEGKLYLCPKNMWDKSTKTQRCICLIFTPFCLQLHWVKLTSNFSKSSRQFPRVKQSTLRPMLLLLCRQLEKKSLDFLPGDNLLSANLPDSCQQPAKNCSLIAPALFWHRSAAFTWTRAKAGSHCSGREKDATSVSLLFSVRQALRECSVTPGYHKTPCVFSIRCLN